MIAALLGVALQVGGAAGGIADRVRLDPAAEVNFHAVASPETVYVGQPVIYELGVFITDELRQRLRKNPEFVPPELRSVVAYDLRDPSPVRTLVRDGKSYEVHVFRRALFPIAPGRIVIPPARLTYSVPLNSSFFSRDEPHLLRSEPVTVEAIPVPSAGRPPGWSGAVGNLRISTSVGAASGRVGDPVVVTVRVSGEANVNLLPRPALAVPWATIVEGPERVTVDSTAAVVRGAKEFDWLVTPTTAGRSEIPPVVYPYFDPSERRYRIAQSAPMPLVVATGSLARVDSSAAPAPTATLVPVLRPAWSRPLPGSPATTLWYWLVMAIAPVPALVRRIRERPRRQFRAPPERALHEIVEAAGASISEMRGAFRHALLARLGTPGLPWADAPALRRTMRHYGVTNETVDRALELFAEMDDATYGRAHVDVKAAGARVIEVYDAIDREARGIVRERKSPLVGAAAFAILLSLAPQTLDDPRVAFNRGVADFQGGNPRAAAGEFFVAARLEPREANAWANAGTASWAIADTAHAVVGWQRALRIDPTDDAVRAQLLAVGADDGAGRDDVWPVPVRLPAWIALLLWCGAWAMLWRRRLPWVAVSSAAVAGVVAVVSLVHARRLNADGWAVIADQTSLRALPALGAEAGVTPLTGELVRVNARSGVWVRIAASGNREGWIDAGRLLDLDGRALHE